jgi:hypothetical protein
MKPEPMKLKPKITIADHFRQMSDPRGSNPILLDESKEIVVNKENIL